MNNSSANQRYPGFWSRAKSLLQAWIKQPSLVSSIAPSSPAVIAAVLRHADVAAANRIVDLGAGTGEITAGLLPQMSPTARLLAVEKSEHLMETLRRLQDSRLTTVNGDAADLPELLRQAGMVATDSSDPNVAAHGQADLIISGIPFSVIPPSVCQQIMQQIDTCLPPGGVFVAYQVSSKVAEYAAPHWGRCDIEEKVWCNLPPLTIYRWQKSNCRSDSASPIPAPRTIAGRSFPSCHSSQQHQHA